MTDPEILFEDNHVLVVRKPSGILSQSDSTGEPDMLTFLKAYLKEKYHKPGDVYLGLLHRLDRPVSGIMVFAKTSKCASRISAQIRERKVEKTYRAVVRGSVSPEEGMLTGYIQKDSSDNQVTVFLPEEGEIVPKDAKKAVLSYRFIKKANLPAIGGEKIFSLLEIALETGRSHQIRAQLARAGWPIIGDRKYGDRRDTLVKDIALEAFRLSFCHPVSGEKMTFTLPLGNREPWSYFINKTEEE